MSMFGFFKGSPQVTPEEQFWDDILQSRYTNWAKTFMTNRSQPLDNKLITSYFSPYQVGFNRCRIGEDFKLDFVVERLHATNDILDIYRMCNDIPRVELDTSTGWSLDAGSWINAFIIMCKMFQDTSTAQNFLHFNLEQNSTHESLWTIYQRINDNVTPKPPVQKPPVQKPPVEKPPVVRQVSFAIIEDPALSQTLFCWSFILVNEGGIENQYRIMAVKDEESFKAFHVKDLGSVLEAPDEEDKITAETFNQNFLHWATIAYQEKKFGISLTMRLAVYKKSTQKSADLQLLSYNIEQDNKPLVAYIRETCTNRRLKEVPDFDVYGVLYEITDKKFLQDAMKKETDTLCKNAIIHIVRKNNYNFIVKIVENCQTEQGKWRKIEVRTDMKALYWTSELLLPKPDVAHEQRSRFWEILSQMIHADEDGAIAETSYMLDYLIESMLNMLFDEKLSKGIEGSIERSNWKHAQESLSKESLPRTPVDADKTVRPYTFQNDNQQIFFFLKCIANQANPKTIPKTHHSNILVVLKTTDNKKQMNKMCILINFEKTLANFYASALDDDFQVVQVENNLQQRKNLDVEDFEAQMRSLNQVIQQKELVIAQRATEIAQEKILLHESKLSLQQQKNETTDKDAEIVLLKKSLENLKQENKEWKEQNDTQSKFLVSSLEQQKNETTDKDAEIATLNQTLQKLEQEKKDLMEAVEKSGRVAAGADIAPI